jgi:hypothetical protein
MVTHTFVGSGTICDDCWMPLSAHETAPLETEPEPDIARRDVMTLDELEEDAIELEEADSELACNVQVMNEACSGHVCPDCQTAYDHDHKCGLPIAIRCCKCISQAAATINREPNLEFLSKRDLTGAEEVGFEVQYTKAIMEQIYGPQGKLRDGWADTIEANLETFRRLIQQYRIAESSTRQIRTKVQNEVTSGMTEEDREAFLLAARRRKKVKSPSDKPLKPKKSMQDVYASIVKVLLAQGLSKADAERNAKIASGGA